LETGCRTDAQATFSPIVAAIDENVEIAPIGGSARGAEESGSVRVVFTYPSGQRAVQVKSTAKSRRVNTELSTIDIEVAVVGEVSIGVGVAGD
jgi:hypothetical protein